MKRQKKIIYRDKKNIYYILKSVRLTYYKAKPSKKKICNKVCISKTLFYKQINRLKRLNDKPHNKK